MQYRIAGYNGAGSGSNTALGQTNTTTDATGNQLNVPGAFTGRSTNNAFSAVIMQTSPGSNDGIANAIAAAGVNGTTFASSDYSTAEAALFPAPLNASFTDYRSGAPNLWVHNPVGSNAASTYGFFGSNPTRNCLFDGALNVSTANCAGTDAIFLGPGIDIGNGFTSNDVMQDDILTSYRVGITGGRVSFDNYFRTGDAADYTYLQYVPGWVAAADEGVKHGLQMLEATNMFTGTVGATGAAGAVSVKITPTSAGSSFNAGGQGQYTGGMLLDLTQVIDTGNTVTAMTQASGNTPGTFTTTGTHTASTVWGVSTTAIPDLSTISITAWSITSNVATFTAANSFATGRVLTLGSFGAGASFFNGANVIVLSTGLSGTQFEVSFTHANGSGSDTGSATGAIPDPTTVSITAWSITSNVATATGPNGLAAGQVIVLRNFDTNAAFFNGVPVTVLATGLSGTQFEFNFVHANASGTDTGQATTQPYGQMEQFSISDANGAFSAGDQVCIAGTYYGEETTLATVTGSGTQTVAARVSYPSATGAFIVKGACRAVTFGADFVSGVADPPYLIVGAPDSTHYWWANYSPGKRYSAGPLAAFNNRSVLPVSIPELNFTPATRTGTTVTLPLNPAAAGVQLAWLNNHAGVVVSGCVDSTFNGTFTPTAVVSPAEGGQASISYTSGSGTASTTGCSASLPTTLAAYKVYPMAWVVDVVDPTVAGTTGYYKSPLTAVDGYLALARNSVTFTAGDSVDEPHLPAALVTDDYEVDNQNSPSPSGVGSLGIEHIFEGTGNTGVYRPLWFHQATSLPFTLFQGYGGDLPPILNYSTLSGAYSTMFNLPFAPIANGSVMTVQCPPSAGDDPGGQGTNCNSGNYYAQFQNLGNGATNGLYFQPSTNTYEWHATAVHLPVASFTANSIGVTSVYGLPSFNSTTLTQPYNHAYTPWGNGAVGDSSAAMGAGTFGAGEIVVGAKIPALQSVLNGGTPGTTTYTYVCTAATAQGEGLPSAPFSTTTGNATLNTTNYNKITCVADVGSQSINVYRTSTTGGLSAGKICSVSIGDFGENCFDTGQAAGAAVPTVDTSGKMLFAGSAFTGVQGSTGTKVLACTGTFTVGHLVTIDVNGNCIDGGVAPTNIANVQIVLPTAALAPNTCSSVITTTMTGVTTTSTFTSAFATDASSVTGYGSSGGLSIVMWPTANANNLKLCNTTASSITPGAMTINVGAK